MNKKPNGWRGLQSVRLRKIGKGGGRRERSFIEHQEVTVDVDRPSDPSLSVTR
jgi:hypothetical protein